MSAQGPLFDSNIRYPHLNHITIIQTNLFFLQHGDSAQRFADVIVNGVSQRIAFIPSDNGYSPFTASVHADLQQGSNNQIIVQGTGSGYGPDIDRIMIPVS